MSQVMAFEPVPVDLDHNLDQTRAEPEPEDDGLGTYDHYQADHYQSDHRSASALSDYSQTSDTPDASSGPPPPSTAFTHPQEPLTQGQALQQSPLPPSSPSLHSPRSTRSPSLAASLGCQSPIRRKPLSPTASPLAVRFSDRGQQIPSHDLQDPEPESGFYSLDSPDLYDQSPGEGAAPEAPLPARSESEAQSESEEE